MLTEVWPLVEKIFIVFAVIVIAAQTYQLCTPHGQYIARRNAIDTINNSNLWVNGLLHLLILCGFYLVLGVIATSLAILVYCIEWAKISTVLSERRKTGCK